MCPYCSYLINTSSLEKILVFLPSLSFTLSFLKMFCFFIFLGIVIFLSNSLSYFYFKEKRVREFVFYYHNLFAENPKDSKAPRKEVIQPQVPLRLPCYDLTPIIAHTLAGSTPASGENNFRGLTGGVYKTRERIHRSLLICDY